MKKTIYLCAGLMLASGMSFAGGADSTAAAPAASPFTFSGYIDSYYFGNLNNPLSHDNLGQSGTARAFDQRSGTFGIGLVQTKFGYSTAKSDVVVDLTFGPNADLGNYGNSPTLAWKASGVASAIPAAPAFFSGISIKQAYFNYKATDKLTLTAGQFGTHIGYEVIDAPVNYNYSLSNLFNNGPFYHIGAKATYAFTEKVSLMAGVVNNVDALYDNNLSKGIISQLWFTPAEKWNVYLNYIMSNEGNPGYDTAKAGKDTTAAMYQVIDVVTGYQVTDKFYAGLNFAYGMQSGNYQAGPTALAKKTGKDSTYTWMGVALYANYAFSDMFGLGLRAEYFDNTSGIRGLTNAAAQAAGVNMFGGTDVTSITLTGNFTLAEGHLLIKPEFRMDSFKKIENKGKLPTTDVQQFQDEKGLWTKNSQSTIGLAAIYKF